MYWWYKKGLIIPGYHITGTVPTRNNKATIMVAFYYGGKMDNVLLEMIEIYKPDGIDWLNYSLSKNNPYTFHHIVEKRNGGKRIVRNGAILTLNGHKFLNYLDYDYQKIYKILNGLFLELNRTEKPPTEDYYEEVNHILRLVPKGIKR